MKELEQQLSDAGYKGEFDLASLIKACGDRFHKLEMNRNDGNSWSAFEFRMSDEWKDGEYHYVLGDTPEKSVIKLWLKLNTR